MSFVAVVITAVVSFVAGLCAEYRTSKADVKALEARIAADARAEIRAALATVTSDIKTWDAKAKEGSESVIAQFEARIKQIL